MIVWNDHSYLHPVPADRNCRTPLCTAISRDEGTTYSASKVLEGDPDGWYCYTAIDFLGEDVLLAYCAGDRHVGHLNRLRITAVPVEWLYAR